MPFKIFNRFLLGGSVLFSILLIGTIGYWYFGDKQYSIIDCLYMTVITITTIGFTEVIDFSNNPGGRIFTIIIAFTGIGTSTFIISNITALIVEGELKETFKSRKMRKAIKKMSDHYIICGVGRVGFHILNELHTTGRKVVVIDNDEAKLSNISGIYPEVLYINGDADIEEVLFKAGIDNAKGIFAATGDDNQNLVISLTAKYLNPAIRVVARCLEAANQTKMKKAGADFVVSENFIAGLRMASEMVRPTVVSFLDRMLSDKDKNLRVEEVPLSEKFSGKTISELELNKFGNTLLLAVASGDDWTYNPKNDHTIKPQSKIVVITNPEERIKLKSELMK
ncbi:MAG: potassium channel family protein [Ignavibacteria bacterium]